MMSPRFCAPLASLLLLAGCATVPGQDRLAERDPYEKFNRGVWGVNQAADKALIKPVAQAYRAVAPRPVRQGVSNFFANLSEPWSFINNVLQGKPNRAGKNFGRFVINSTIGLGGLIGGLLLAGLGSASLLIAVAILVIITVIVVVFARSHAFPAPGVR